MYSALLYNLVMKVTYLVILTLCAVTARHVWLFRGNSRHCTIQPVASHMLERQGSNFSSVSYVFG